MHLATQPLGKSQDGNSPGGKNLSKPPFKPGSPAVVQAPVPPAGQARRPVEQHSAAPLRVQHRIDAVMAHVPWYAFKSQARLAADTGFSKSAISRLLRGECTPTLALACALTQTLEKRLGKPLDLRELFSLDGTYPTPSACQLVGCANCLPAAAYDQEDNLRPEYKNVPAGQWSVAASQQPPTAVAPIQQNSSQTQLHTPSMKGAR